MNIKTIRKERGQTQAEVASSLRITRAAYTNIENGKRDPDTATLKAMAQLFDCTTDELLGINQSPALKSDSFGERVRAERIKKGISQAELSTASGVAQQTISAIESGRNSPSERTIVMLAAALSCPVGYLLGETRSTVGDAIKRARRAKGLSQVALALSAGISQSTLSAIETGAQNPSVATLEAIAAALSCPVGELLGEKKNSPSPEGEELRETVFSLVSDLPAEDLRRVQDFVAGLTAARRGD